MRLVLTHFAHRPTDDNTFHLPSGDETSGNDGGSWYAIKVVNATKMFTTCDICRQEREARACLVWSRVSAKTVAASGAPDNATIGR